MNIRIAEAVDIANNYRHEHNGEIPVLIVAHKNNGERVILVGKFRPDERGNGEKTRADQKMFVSLLRIAFAMMHVTSYEVIAKPSVDNHKLQLTQNLLSIFTVDADGAKGEFFEIEDEALTPCYTDLEVGSWFTSILPSEFAVNVDRKTQVKIEKYIAACTYHMPVADPINSMDTLDMLDSIFA